MGHTNRTTTTATITALSLQTNAYIFVVAKKTLVTTTTENVKRTHQQHHTNLSNRTHASHRVDRTEHHLSARAVCARFPGWPGVGVALAPASASGAFERRVQLHREGGVPEIDLGLCDFCRQRMLVFTKKAFAGHHHNFKIRISSWGKVDPYKVSNEVNLEQHDGWGNSLK